MSDARLLGSTVRPDPTTVPTLVALDVDGTLLTSRHEITRGVSTELDRVRRQGVEIVLTSSRGPTAVREILLKLRLTEPAVFVASQGAVVGSYDRHGRVTLLDRSPAPAGAARAVVSTALRSGLAVNWFSGDRWLVSHIDVGVEREMAIVGAAPRVQDLLAQAAGPDKLLIIARDERDVSRLDAIAQGVPPELAATVSDPLMIEITRRDVDKATGLSWYCERRGIDRSSVVALGDGPNDLGMFRFAGVSVAPLNARPAVLAAATWLTRSNDDDGVAWALSVLFPDR